MSVEPDAGVGPAPATDALEAILGEGSRDRRRPNVSGDLPTVFLTGPMFRRTVGGYDRFQVDTYVQWAEDELATADREREHLLARHLRTRSELEQAQLLLTHSSDGGEMLRLSERIGSMLAAAADEAKSMKSEARATRRAARANAKRMVARAERRIAEADETALGMVAQAATEVEAMHALAAQMVEDAELAGREARAEAQARLAKVREIELRAAEEVALVRQRSAEEVRAARLQARDEVVRMLSTGREERRRADDAAAAVRARLDQEAAMGRAGLLAEVATLELRRAFLRAEVDRLTHVAGSTTRRRLDVPLRQVLDRLHWRPRSLRAP